MIDGSVQGNPGPGAVGVVIQAASGDVVEAWGEAIGHVTNNQAEYQALLAALRRARSLRAKSVTVRSDSQLLVRQMTGAYRVKHPGLLHLNRAVRRLLETFEQVRFTHVDRGSNAEADRLANLAIDQALAVGSRR